MTRPVTSLAVLIACHNRREVTLRCLGGLRDQDASIALEVFLVDDGSTDGTADAVRAQFPDVHIVQGSGTLYWVGGMRLAYDAALAAGFEDMLWLNDDVTLASDAVRRLLATLSTVASAPEPDAIVVGAVRDPVLGTTAYSGLRRVGRFRHLLLVRVEPQDEPVRCNTHHGNVVLVPAAVRRSIGNLDGRYTHAMADVDYGLRASALGHPVWLAPGFVGTCAQNFQRAAWEDPAIPRRERLRAVLGPKGRPIREWVHHSRQHGGPLWFVHAVSPYTRALFGSTRATAHVSRVDR